jgi:hypothetical protein
MFFKKKELTDDELLNLVVERFDMRPEILTKEEEDAVFKDLAGVENLMEFLNALMLLDVKKHFKAANPADQIRTRGAYARALYLKSRIMKAKQPASDVEIPKIGKRYA